MSSRGASAVVSAKSKILQQRLILEAEGYLELGMPCQAWQALKRIDAPLKRFAGHVAYLRGESLRELDQFDEALPQLLQAAEQAPENIAVWVGIGWCYKRMEQLPRAMDALLSALRQHPEEPILHYNLACYQSLAGMTDRALKSLTHAVKLDSTYRELAHEESDFEPIRHVRQFQELIRLIA